jgi:hypothetical protein
VQLINFLGTPQGQLIADAVTATTIPEPWATMVREELTLLAEQQRGVRQQQIGQGVGIGLVATAASASLFLYGILTGSGPVPAAA